jgi:hypothetical protein
MTIAVRRRNRTIGKVSRFLNIPMPVLAGEESTIVAGRIIVADPRGEIPESELQEFMEEFVEPVFWVWMQKRKGVIKRATE